MQKPVPGCTIALLLLACILLASPGCVAGKSKRGHDDVAGNTTWPGSHDIYLTINGSERHYVAHVPLRKADDLPLVIALHGAGGSSSAMIAETGWADKGEAEGFVTVFPDALAVDLARRPSFLLNPRIWNDGSGRGRKDPDVNDDVEFIGRIIDDMVTNYSVDPGRVYITGLSNGGSMTFRAAAGLSGRIAAIGIVSSICYVSPEGLESPVPMIYLLGTRDPINTINGGRIRTPWGAYEDKPPVNDSITRWVILLNASPVPEAIAGRDGIYAVRYSGGREGSAVDYYLIEGAGHVWPGKKSTLPELMVGPSTDRINATDVIWEFFRDHPGA
jgi:polyhydroxybutyrate depolymerase